MEPLQRLIHGPFEHLVDPAPLDLDLEDLLLEPLAFADRAGHPHIGEEVHFEPRRAVALARLAAAAGTVEAEPRRRIAAHLRVGHAGKQVTDLVEDLDVRRRIRPRRAADR